MGDVVRLVTPTDETNEETIDILERALKDAREGKIIEVALACVMCDRNVETGRTSSNNSILMLGAIYRLAHRLQMKIYDKA